METLKKKLAHWNDFLNFEGCSFMLMALCCFVGGAFKVTEYSSAWYVTAWLFAIIPMYSNFTSQIEKKNHQRTFQAFMLSMSLLSVYITSDMLMKEADDTVTFKTGYAYGLVEQERMDSFTKKQDSMAEMFRLEISFDEAKYAELKSLADEVNAVVASSSYKMSYDQFSLIKPKFAKMRALAENLVIIPEESKTRMQYMLDEKMVTQKAVSYVNPVNVAAIIQYANLGNYAKLQNDIGNVFLLLAWLLAVRYAFYLGYAIFMQKHDVTEYKYEYRPTLRILAFRD